MNFRHTGSGQSDNEIKANGVSKKGNGKSMDTGDNNTPKIKLAHSIMHTLKNLLSSYMPSEDRVEVPLKDGYRTVLLLKGNIKQHH